MTTRPFPDFDELQRDRIAEIIGTRMAAATGIATIGLIRDPAVTPRALIAGLIEAHLQGAAAAITSGYAAGCISVEDGLTIVDAIEYLFRKTIASCFASDNMTSAGVGSAS